MRLRFAGVKIGNRGLRLIREGVLPGVMTVSALSPSKSRIYSPPSPARRERARGLHMRSEIHLSRAAVESIRFSAFPPPGRWGTANSPTNRHTSIARPQSATRMFSEFPSSPKIPAITGGSLRHSAQIFRAEARPATPSAVSPPRRVVSSYVFDRKPLKEYCLSLREDVAARPRTSHGISTKQRKIAIDWLGPKTSGLFAGGYGGVPRKP